MAINWRAVREYQLSGLLGSKFLDLAKLSKNPFLFPPSWVQCPVGILGVRGREEEREGEEDEDGERDAGFNDWGFAPSK